MIAKGLNGATPPGIDLGRAFSQLWSLKACAEFGNKRLAPSAVPAVATVPIKNRRELAGGSLGLLLFISDLLKNRLQVYTRARRPTRNFSEAVVSEIACKC